MLQPAPKSPETAKYKNESDEPISIEHSFKAIERIRKLVPKFAGASLFLTLSAGYWADVSENRALEEQASIYLDNRVAPLEPDSESSTIFIDGYGSMNANYLADRLGPVTQSISDGTLYSANFSDAPIDPHNLADRIVEQAQRDNTNSVSLFGFSAGGILGVESAEQLITHSDIRVDTIILNATPSGPESLREERIEQIGWLNTIARLPGAKYSSAVRYLVSMASDYDQYSDGNLHDFWEVSSSNIDRIHNHDEPGLRQLEDQALAIMNADLHSNLQRIGELRGEKQMPVIVYLAAEDSSTDHSVDNAAASESICSSAEEAGLTCLIYTVPNSGHSIYSLDIDAYNQALTQAGEEIRMHVQQERAYFDILQNPWPISLRLR